MFHWYGTFQDFYEFGKNPNFLILKTLSAISEYNVTKNIFANSYPWFFPEGIGDMYDMTQGKVSINDWGNHLLRYYDMVSSYKIPYLDFSYTIQYRDIQAIVRATSSYHRIDLSEGTHQLLRIYKGR
jgi:hypothetical protein